jgi:hypothetical protein
MQFSAAKDPRAHYKRIGDKEGFQRIYNAAQMSSQISGILGCCSMLTIASVKYHNRASVLCAFSNGYAIGDGSLFGYVSTSKIH